MPRLSRLHEALPDLEVSFAIARSADPLTPDVDCAIRLGAGTWPGYNAQRLFRGDLVPICAPNDAAPEEVKSRRDMTGRRLIRPFHSGALADPWQAWLGEEADEILPTVDSIELRAEGLSYQAAQQGMGIALARIGFVIDDIAAGHLRAVLPPLPHEDYAYHLVYPSGGRQNPNLPAFRKWLTLEAAVTEESIRQHFETSS
jgi:LysR family glycine cleavage system transcriptional activator/LysR family transcriptional regulator of beta-lactamase